jgi:hypothetical protein
MTMEWDDTLAKGEFERAERDWAAITSSRRDDTLVAWERDLALIDREQRDLERAGRWVSGPSDLMAVLRITGDELRHSDMLAWLLSPTRRHGFGDAFLKRLADLLWPNASLPEGPIIVERERVDRLEMGTRADILLWAGESLIVIENKVYSPEGLDQCERLYRAWTGTVDDVRFLLLSRSGAAPVTASTPEAREAWTSASYALVASILEDLAGAGLPSDELAASTIRQYVATLRRHIA